MNSKLKIIVSAICIFALLFGFSSCKGEEQKEPDATEIEYFTITFNSNGGSSVDSITIQSGQYASEPPSPTLDNHVFKSWALNGETFYFDVKKITKNITLDAIWIPADKLFGITAVDDGIGITEIKEQHNLHTLTVPSLINGKSVVAILDGAFEDVHKSYAEHIVFPSSVVSVGTDAFKNVLDVELTFEGKLTYIGESAFENCALLEKVSLNEGLEKIPFRAFDGCKALKTLDIPTGVTIIEENAFEGCESMLTVVLPSTLVSIENGAFEDTKLKTIFFAGNEEQYENLEIKLRNDGLKDATVYFYSEIQPTSSGNFWHYGKNGAPQTW